MVFFARKRVGFVEEYYLRIVYEHILTHRTAYGSDGQCRVVRRGRTYRSGIRVGNHVGVTLFSAVARVVTVARRRYKAYTRLVYFVVNGVYIVLVFTRSRKSAGRTERHIDCVYPDKHRVFERGKNIFRSSARIEVGEYFH